MILLFACAPALTTGPAELPRSEVIDGIHTAPDGVSARYRMVLPDAELTGLLLFFPWDGAGWRYRRAANRRAALAAAHGLVLISVEAPENQDCWWAPAAVKNARYVDSLVQDILGRYGLDPERVFTTGLSGGADFAAAFFVHTGFRYGGGVVALCGGDLPRLDGGDCAAELDPPPAPIDQTSARAAAGRVRFDFAITADDPLFAGSARAAALYTDLGFETRHRVVSGSGHCGFDEGFDALEALSEGLNWVAATPGRGAEQVPPQ